MPLRGDLLRHTSEEIHPEFSVRRTLYRKVEHLPTASSCPHWLKVVPEELVHFHSGPGRSLWSWRMVLAEVEKCLIDVFEMRHC